MKSILDLAIKEVTKRYAPHTLILYGSHARNEATETSDIDIACFWDRSEAHKESWLLHGTFLDIWIYPTAFFDSIPDEALRFGDGKVIFEKRGLGTDYINRVKKKLVKGKEPMSKVDKLHLRNWVVKMLERIREGNLDSNYRRTWLQYELLELYFEVRGIWYLGSKKSFSHLKQNDWDVYNLFAQVYQNPLDLDLLYMLAKKVICIEYRNYELRSSTTSPENKNLHSINCK
ncbi:nucleotidyltransferase domain-containing protein [Vibrio mediterranei]|uniref:nucleotidyltransferase domain-containing protein n=1 Tax=Vibrio mediterranei TaxID=689 RepID=UPI0022837EB8|nr:nucleotidyltransferase domain-containing protein [Vibrio mediterranei]MCY9855380.1 nucleotidyltransferase domain-containing protein [Vibrio mediterranei]